MSLTPLHKIKISQFFFFFFQMNGLEEIQFGGRFFVGAVDIQSCNANMLPDIFFKKTNASATYTNILFPPLERINQ